MARVFRRMPMMRRRCFSAQALLKPIREMSRRTRSFTSLSIIMTSNEPVKKRSVRSQARIMLPRIICPASTATGTSTAPKSRPHLPAPFSSAHPRRAVSDSHSGAPLFSHGGCKCPTKANARNHNRPGLSLFLIGNPRRSIQLQPRFMRSPKYLFPLLNSHLGRDIADADVFRQIASSPENLRFLQPTIRSKRGRGSRSSLPRGNAVCVPRPSISPSPSILTFIASRA